MINFVIMIELGIIAIIGIIISILFLRLVLILKKNSTTMPYTEAMPSFKAIQANTDYAASVQNSQIQRVQPESRPKVSLQQEKEARIDCARRPSQPVAYQNDKQQTIQSDDQKEIGLVFCRSCGQSYLSNEKACPKCGTLR